MTLPVLVVDDSALARKILINSLPPDWDIDITQATNGVEALTLYREGKASVMFLDLTMPEMDGFQVLAQLRQEGLDVFVIVVSADVQAGAIERAKALGAMAFIQKPVNTARLVPVLKEYGLYD
jgi:two-component system, chemotaxis family, chemotaxis protein CheY